MGILHWGLGSFIGDDAGELWLEYNNRLAMQVLMASRSDKVELSIEDEVHPPTALQVLDKANKETGAAKFYLLYIRALVYARANTLSMLPVAVL